MMTNSHLAAFENKNNAFLMLPTEILLQIIDLLNVSDIRSLSKVSSRLKRVARDNHLWWNIFQHYFLTTEDNPITLSPTFCESSDIEEEFWYRKFSWQMKDYMAALERNKRFLAPQKSVIYYANYFSWIKENRLSRLAKMDVNGQIVGATFTLDDLKVIDMYDMTMIDWAKRYKYRSLLHLIYQTLISYSYSASEVIHSAILAHQPVEEVLKQLSISLPDNLNMSEYAYSFVEDAFFNGTTCVAEALTALCIKDENDALKTSAVISILNSIYASKRFEIAMKILPLIAEHNHKISETSADLSNNRNRIDMTQFFTSAIESGELSLAAEIYKLLPATTKIAPFTNKQRLAKMTVATFKVLHSYDPELIHDIETLRWLATYDRIDILRYCRQEGVSTTLIFAVTAQFNTYWAEQFLTSETDLNAVIPELLSPLRVAIRTDASKLIAKMIAKDPTILHGQAGVEALFEIIESNVLCLESKLLILRLFLDASPDFLSRSLNGKTALMMACDLLIPEIVALFLKRGALVSQTLPPFQDQNYKDTVIGRTALYYVITSVRRGSYARVAEILDLLQAFGVDLTQRFNGETILHILVTQNNLSWFQALINKIVKDCPGLLEAKDQYGNTPLAAALRIPPNWQTVAADHLFTHLHANPNVEVYIDLNSPVSNVLFMYALRGNSRKVRKIIDLGVGVKSTLKSNPLLSHDDPDYGYVHRAHELILAMKAENQKDEQTYRARQKVKAIQNTAMILKAIENGALKAHLVKSRNFFNKPSPTLAKSSILKFQEVIGESNARLFPSSFSENGKKLKLSKEAKNAVLSKEVRKTIQAFSKLEKAYRRLK